MNKVLLYGGILLVLGISMLVISSEISSGLISCYDYAKSQVEFTAIRQTPIGQAKVDVCVDDAVRIEGYQICVKKYTDFPEDMIASDMNKTLYEYKIVLSKFVAKAMRPTLKEPSYFAQIHNDLCAPVAVIEL